MNAVAPSYYLVHDTPAGRRYAYPRARLALAAAKQRWSNVPDQTRLEISNPAGAQHVLTDDWLIADSPVLELRSTRPGNRVRDGWEKRDHVNTDGPVSPDLAAAFAAAPDQPATDDVEHYTEHDAAHACWQCLVFTATYAHRYVPGAPIVETEQLDGWAELAGDPDPDPALKWRVQDPSLLAVYGAHTAHLWPGQLDGLREAVAARLNSNPLVTDFYDWHNSPRSRDYVGFSITVRVPWENHRTSTRTEKHPLYPRRKARPVTRDEWAIQQRVMLEVPDGVAAPTKADAIAGFDAVVARQVRRFLPFGDNPRACDHCNGTGRVSNDA